MPNPRVVGSIAAACALVTVAALAWGRRGADVREALDAARPVLDGFLTDAAGGRTDAALAAATPQFRADAAPARFAQVAAEMTKLLGRPSGAGEMSATLAETDDARRLSAAWTERFERGDAKVEAVALRRGEGPWLVDDCAVRAKLFVFHLRRAR